MSKQRGYTLSEMLVVLALAGLVLGISLPALAKLIPSIDLQGAVDQVTQDLALARLRAVERRQTVTVTATTGAPGYRIDPSSIVRRLPKTIVVTSFPTVTFDPRGLLPNANSVAIVLTSAKAGTRTITVSPAGSMRVTP